MTATLRLETEGSCRSVTFSEVVETRKRLAPYLSTTPLRSYPLLDAHLGADLACLVKHENHQPTGSFKARNGLAFVTSLSADERERGVVAASTGNHGQAIAYAAALLGVRATICVPVGNNPEKNAAIRSWGAYVHEEGGDYDEAVEAMRRMARASGAVVAHSTNHWSVVAGAATLTLEMLEQAGRLDAIVLGVGGGSQAAGALVVTSALAPNVAIYAAQAAGACAIHDSWHARRPFLFPQANTFAEGLATRQPYAQTFSALCAGLTDFVTVTDAELAEAIRQILRLTHSVVEGAGAIGLAAASRLRHRLRGQRVGIVFSGGNLDTAQLKRILNDADSPLPTRAPTPGRFAPRAGEIG